MSQLENDGQGFFECGATPPSAAVSTVGGDAGAYVPNGKAGGPQEFSAPQLSQASAIAGEKEENLRALSSHIRVLVVDDEDSILSLISLALKHEGFLVETARYAEEAFKKIALFQPDLAVFDIMLPDYDGVQLLRKIRDRGYTLPVVFLTALDSVDARIKGLTAGGDDYITKPFSVEELIARVRGILRRSQHLYAQAAADPVIRIGKLLLNEESYEVFLDGEPVQLTATEFELLRYLMRNAGTVLTKDQILDRVWDYSFEGNRSIVELYISYLRKKLKHGKEPIIHTVRGIGYMIKAADRSSIAHQ